MADESTPRSTLNLHKIEIQPQSETVWYPLTDVDGYEIGRSEESSSTRKVAGDMEKTEETDTEPDTLSFSGPFQIGSKAVELINAANDVASQTIKVKITLDGNIVDTTPLSSSEKIKVETTGEIVFTGSNAEFVRFRDEAKEGLFLILGATTGTTALAEADIHEIERVVAADNEIYTAKRQAVVADKDSGNAVYEYPTRERIFTVRPTSKISESASAGELVEGTATFSIRTEGAITNTFKSKKG